MHLLGFIFTEMQNYSTLATVLEDLQKRGFVHDFTVAGDCIACEEVFAVLPPGEYTVCEVYRFEVSEEPLELASIFAVSSTRGLKGIVVNPCGNLPEPCATEKAALYELCPA